MTATEPQWINIIFKGALIFHFKFFGKTDEISSENIERISKLFVCFGASNWHSRLVQSLCKGPFLTLNFMFYNLPLQIHKIWSLTPSKVLPLFDITEHKAVACLVLPR